MSNKFKVGDKVKCIRDGFCYIKLHEELVVADVQDSGSLSFAGLTANYNPDRFVLVSQPNGVDGDGNPIEFTVDDLKPFQRVVTRNGSLGVVGYEQSGLGLCICLAGQASYVQAYFDHDSQYYIPYIITEVYDPPHVTRAMEYKERGALVFKLKDFEAERAAKLEEAEKAIAQAEAALAAAKAAKDAI